MRKPSDIKRERVAEFTRVRDVLAQAAQFASTADAALVEHVARGARFCSALLVAEISSNKTGIYRAARALDTGTAGKSSVVALACRAYALALGEFVNCDYAGAQSSLKMAETILKP